MTNPGRTPGKALDESSPSSIVQGKARKTLPQEKRPAPFQQATDLGSQTLKPLEQVTPMSTDIPGLIRRLESGVIGKPSIAKLMTSSFGRPCLLHSFTSGKVFDHVLIFVLKTSFLAGEDLAALLFVHPLYRHLYTSCVYFRKYEFSSLRDYDLNYDKQEEIPDFRLKMLLSAALHYNFHLPSVYRYLQGNYTCAWRNLSELMAYLKDRIPDDCCEHLERVFKVGSPAKMVAHSTHENFLKYKRYGNHSSISYHMDLVKKSINKEEKHKYIIPFPTWITRFVPDLHLSPMGILVKPQKEPRFIFDGSFRMDAHAVPVNDWPDVSAEFDLRYGTCFQRHLVWIWNLRISYPATEILLWDDDGSGAFRNAKYHPDLALAFAFRIGHYLCIPTGVCFGGNTSPNPWEVIAWVRSLLASSFFFRSDLVSKHKEFLDQVRYEGLGTDDVIFSRAAADALNKGAFTQQGDRLPSPHNTFVDDNLMADIPRYIKPTIAASIESLFILLGRPDISRRRLALSREKFLKSACSYRRTQLGFLVTTRDMTVSLPPDKRRELRSELLQWHGHRKKATLRQFAVLMGKMVHLSTICHWGRYLVSELQHSITIALKINKKHVALSSAYVKLLALIQEESNRTGVVDSQTVAFLSNQVSKKIWSCSVSLFFTKELIQEIATLYHIFENPDTFFWGVPIGHLIPRDPSYRAWGDSSTDSGGGFSPCLTFWWFVNWPAEVRHRTIKFFKADHGGSDEFVSINALEFVVVILNYAASKLAILQNKDRYDIPNPVLMNYADNTSAVAWTKRAARSSPTGKALGRILCNLLINSPLALQSEHVAGTDNTIADRISRSSLHKSHTCPNFVLLEQEFPILSSCRRYQPSQELLSALYQALSSGSGPVRIKKVPLGHFVPGKHTG